MKRFYYISDDLDDLERIEHDLEAGGIARPQIYLLSNDDVGLDNHDVNRVASFLKTDVIHSGEIGAVLGLAVAAVILLVSHFSGIAAQVGAFHIPRDNRLSVLPPGRPASSVRRRRTFISPDSKRLWIKDGTSFCRDGSGRSEKTQESFKTTSQTGASRHRGDSYSSAHASASKLGEVQELGFDFSGPSEQTTTITRLQSTATN